MSDTFFTDETDIRPIRFQNTVIIVLSTKRYLFLFSGRGSELSMADVISGFSCFIAGFAKFGKDIFLMLLSMVPVVELKGAIPIAAAIKVKWYRALLCTTTGNIIPMPFVLSYGSRFFEKLKKIRWIDAFISKINHYLDNQGDFLKRHASLAIILAISIPFTGIGGWGGSVIASMIELDKKEAFIAVVIGILISGIITTGVTYGLFMAARHMLGF